MIADIVHDTKHSLVISDVGAWLTAWLVIFLAVQFLLGRHPFPGKALDVFPGLLILWLMSMAVAGSYKPATRLHTASRLFTASVIFGALSIVLGSPSLPVMSMVFLAALAAGLAFLFRIRVPWRVRRWVRGKQHETVLILGEKSATGPVEAELQRGLRLGTMRAEFPSGPGLEERLTGLLAGTHAKEILCVAPEAMSGISQTLKDVCRRQHVDWQFVPVRESPENHGFGALFLGDIPVMGPNSSSITGFNLLYKTAFDLCLGSLLLLCAAPVMVLIAIGIRLTSSGPAVLAQERVGHLGNHFTMYKFRTMYENTNDERHREYVQNWMKNRAHTESNGQKIFKITNDDRITPFGRLLRQYSLDELPQILNVLKLEMSIVGPRPAMPYELQGYSPWHLERLNGPPGLTGPWQVNGRNHLSFDEMVQLDVSYLRRWSPFRDLVLIARTVPAMLFGKGH